MNFELIAKDVLSIEANELKKSSENLELSDLKKAIEIMHNTKGKVIISGVGKSGLVATKIAATLSSTGTSSFFLHPTEAMHGDLGMINSQDTVLAISYSGESSELTQILPHLKRLSIPMIAMSKTKDSTLGKYCDAFISINVQKEACPLNIAPTSSTTLTMAMGDVLAICLMKKRNFKKEDFASFHPGGSLGKKLFIKIDELLKTQNLPIVSRETKLKDAIIVMNKCRLGNVIIKNEQNEVIALLSDGDLRRALMSSDFSLDCKIETIATKNPKTITNRNLLASDAIKVIEDFKIQLLIVVDEYKKLVGVLHIHDLIEAGIK